MLRICLGVDLGKKEFQNFGDLNYLNKNLDETCRMCWFDGDEDKVSTDHVIQRDSNVQPLNCLDQCYTYSTKLKC